MGSACLGNPRKGKEIMKQTINEPQKRYKDYQSTKVKKEMVAGQIEGEQIKISKNLFLCSICTQNYNLAQREPVIVCSNHHTYCRQCMESASNYNKKCPQCRSDLLPLVRNRDIYQLVEDNLKQLQQDRLAVIKEQSSFLVLSIDHKNKYIHNFWIEGARIMKIDDNLVWEGIMSNETMFRDRECIFSLKVIQSKFNNIEIGLVGKGYKLQKNITCKQSVVYHLADGMILEGIPGRSNEWKAKGTKLQSGKQFSIEVRVDIPNKSIRWLKQDVEVGKARLSDYILEHECVAYILMSHKEDIIELNA